MKVNANRLEDVVKNKRAALRELFYERAVAKYSFSYKRLAALLDSLNCEDINQELKACVLGFSDEDTKTAVEDMNDRIQAIYAVSDLQESETGSVTVLAEDPFGRVKDYILISSSSSSFSKDTCIDGLVRRFKLKATEVMEVFQAATKSKPYVTLQARDHREGEQQNHHSKKGAKK